MKLTRIALAAAGAFLLAACSGGGSDSSSDESSPATKLAGEVAAVVDTSLSPCNPTTAARDGNCWLPLYAGPGFSTLLLNKGGECAKDERACWPQPGEELPAVCLQEGGQLLSNTEQRATTVWVGVAIPRGRVLAPKYSPELDKKGRAVVFASELWLKIDEDAKAKVPDCTAFFATTNGS